MAARKNRDRNITSINQSGGITAGSVNVTAGTSKESGWRWTERWSWIAGIIVALITLAGVLMSLKGGKTMKQESPKNPKQGTTNITSYNQSGGITAHTVNVGPGKRTLNESVQQQLDNLVKGKKKVDVVAIMGDAEAFQFATEIFEYLKRKNVPVDGVHQDVLDRPVAGQLVKELPDDGLEILIGSRQ